MLFHYKTIKVSLDPENRSVSVLLNRPCEKNAINREMIFELESIFNWIAKYIEINAVLLSSTSDYFSMGLDRGELSSLDNTKLAESLKRLQKVIYGMYYLPQTIVCDLKTGAMGVGIELALGSDLRLGHREARLMFNFLNRGLPPSCGAVGLLSLIVGQGLARTWLLSDRPLEGDILCQSGLVSHLYDSLDNEESLGMLEAICRQSPTTRIQAKGLLLETIRPTLERSREYESRFASGALQSDDWKTALDSHSPVYRRPSNRAELLKK